MQRSVEKFGISNKRGRPPTSSDPYQPETGFKDSTICQECFAVYRHKRWQLDPDMVKKLENSPMAHWVTCPGCRKVAENYPEGVVTLRGDYLWDHEKEIRNILHNEADRITAKNPLAKIVDMASDSDGLVIKTTEQKLAEHLGRFLNRAHGGQLHLDWSGSPRICRVSWERWQ